MDGPILLLISACIGGAYIASNSVLTNDNFIGLSLFALESSHPVTFLLYFCYTGSLSIIVFLILGAVGTLSSWWFLSKLYKEVLEESDDPE